MVGWLLGWMVACAVRARNVKLARKMINTLRPN